MFLALGLVCIGIAISWPLAFLDHRLLTAHMIRHLLLMSAGPPLILSGLKRPWLKVSPALGWFAGAAVLIGWHIPVVFDAAMRWPSIHFVEDFSFLLAGFLFWSPVFQAGQPEDQPESWFVPLYLFLATVPCDILSGFLVFCGRIVYPHYLHAPGLFHLSAGSDQELAGALMWVAVTFIYLTPATLFTLRALSPARMSEGLAR